MAYSSLIRKMGRVAVLCVLLCLSACNEADEPRVMPVAESVERRGLYFTPSLPVMVGRVSVREKLPSTKLSAPTVW